MLKKGIAIVLIAIVVVAIPYLQGDLENSGWSGTQVYTEFPKLRTIKRTVIASGKISYEQKVSLTSEVIGKVKKIYVTEGDRVEVGDLVLEIDDEALQLLVEQSKLDVELQKTRIEKDTILLEKIRENLLRLEELYQAGMVDEKKYKDVLFDYQIQQVQKAEAKNLLRQKISVLSRNEDKLAKTLAHSPIAGIITSLDIKKGETAISSSTNIPGSQLMSISDPHSLTAVVYVDEADIAKMKIGQEANVVTISHPNAALGGLVTYIAQHAKVEEGRSGNTFRIKIKVESNPSSILRSGMTCRVEILIHESDETISVPLIAITNEVRQSNGRNTGEIFTVREGKAYLKTVLLGSSDDEHQEILDGIKASEQVVIGPSRVLQSLRSGESVHVSTS